MMFFKDASIHVFFSFLSPFISLYRGVLIGVYSFTILCPPISRVVLDKSAQKDVTCMKEKGNAAFYLLIFNAPAGAFTKINVQTSIM